MIWLVVTWVGLVAVWGVSEHWELRAAVKRVVQGLYAWSVGEHRELRAAVTRVGRGLRALRRHEAPHPFDWADG